MGVVAVVAVAVFGVFATRGNAQEAPPLTLPILTTTTTAPPPPSSGDPSTTTPPPDGSTPPTAPPADPSGDGDGTSPDGTNPAGGGPGQVVPADIQAALDAMVRSGANDNHLLVAGEKALLASGVDPDTAARVAYGNFPVAGPTAWVDDWHAARFTGTTFRFHLGLDLIAAYGTPLRSPAEGVARMTNDALGGLAVKVFLPDGTFFYMCHMSAYAPGLVDGQVVHVGDLVGYVGQSGDATGPHLHFGIYQGGSTPIPPKPIVDQWVADQSAKLPGIIAGITGQTPRPLLATAIVSQLTQADTRAAETPGGTSRTELLFATSTNPSGGALQVAQATAAQAAGSVDWVQQANMTEAYDRAWQQAMDRAWLIVAPLTSPLFQQHVH